jgi:NADPH:quinone reductase-like Zn-dependent oxidoreductase
MRLLVRLIMGPIRPRQKVLGQEFAGDVEACGAGGSRFRVGEAVYGTTGFRFGAYAEYLCLPEAPRGGVIAPKPTNMSYEEAATVPTGGLEALHLLQRCGDLAGRRVLVNGAGGGIGMYAVQLAKHFGAEVTGVDSPRKMELVRSLGADRAIDFTHEDFTDSVGTYDVIFDVVGTSSVAKCLRALRSGGLYFLANPRWPSMLRGRWPWGREHKRVIRRPLPPTVRDLEFLRELIEAGRIRAVVDRRFPLEQVPEAHRYVDAGLARGRVVILP